MQSKTKVASKAEAKDYVDNDFIDMFLFYTFNIS